MVQDIEDIVKSSIFIDFQKSMVQFSDKIKINHTMLGFNFMKNEISSIKFYYVFFGKLPAAEFFPIPELQNEYDQLISISSEKHLINKYLAGGGLTLTIKFDDKNNASKGFFLRLESDNSRLKANAKKIYGQFHLEDEDFEDGFGQYIMLKGNQIEKSRYMYLKNTGKIQRLYDIPFDISTAIELSAIETNGTKESKLIAIGTSEMITDEFYRSMPKTIQKLNRSNLVCPSINLHTKEHSIYYFSMCMSKDGFKNLFSLTK
jgi:hypothetical protein